MKRASLSLILLFAAGFVIERDGSAQRRRSPTSAKAAPSKKPTFDYSTFSHATKKHQQACNTCHKTPTRNWQKVREFPDVADYPDHDACVSCHRPQFFRGASPVICAVCHSQVGPRAEARFVFRNPTTPRQFTIEFPHDKHQDVIASVRPSALPTNATFFRRAAFRSTVDEQARTYNNCTICHGARTTLPNVPPGGWVDGFVPDSLTFKAVPTSHASCFNCHWKSQQPTRENCDGCHKLASAAFPTELPTRLSIKFKHEGGGERKNHVAECTTCHINITRQASLRGLKPDVPITSCTECHNKDGLRLDVSGELAQVDKNRDFVCVYCHASNVGRLDPPATHYLIAGREPMTRKTLK
jgi:LSD1 subclass zinc finger protein